MNWGERKFENVKNGKINRNVRTFFEDFIVDGLFNGVIVVGAPDPRSLPVLCKGWSLLDTTCFFLGSFCSLPQNFVVKLDVDAKSEKISRTENIISIGGPGTNIITSEFNRYLPIRFDESNYWSGLINHKEELIRLIIMG